MSSSLVVYTVEYGNSSDRSFAMSSATLKRGFDYSGVLLHSSEDQANEAMASDIADGESPDEMRVAVLKINRNGDLYDAYGVMLHDTIALQNNQSKREVRQHLQEYFLHEMADRRSKIDMTPDLAMGM
ncbi:hypothetical protein IFT48_00510 [Pseudomonas fluorescens]|nr:hypothetical protein [Pseudomonas fluorescens]MBD8615081.1 hypothetical protein [Pseudomonas putida]MBD8681243.1 hypothetical protein [Pseudomonas sp. CFBP 13719]